MPPATLEQCMALWPDVGLAQAYGQTELAPIATMLSMADHREGGHRLKSAGRPTAVSDMRIVDEAGNESAVIKAADMLVAELAPGGEIVQLDDCLQQITAIHQYAPAVSQLLGEFLAAISNRYSGVAFAGPGASREPRGADQASSSVSASSRENPRARASIITDRAVAGEAAGQR